MHYESEERKGEESRKCGRGVQASERERGEEEKGWKGEMRGKKERVKGVCFEYQNKTQTITINYS